MTKCRPFLFSGHEKAGRLTGTSGSEGAPLTAERNLTLPVVPFILAQPYEKGKLSSATAARQNRVDADIAGGPDAPAEALEEHDERNQKENEKDNRQNLRALAFFTRRHNYLLLRKERESKFFLHLYFLTHETTCHLLFQAPESEVSLLLY